MRYHTGPVLSSSACTLLLCLALLLLPLVSLAEPVGDHLVGTVLGEAEGLAEHDFRTGADVLELTDFAFLPNGDMLVADGVQGRVLRVHADGIVRPFAGNGSSVSSGNGGPAIDAGIPNITRIAVDGAGNVYVAQNLVFYGVIRKIDTEGVIEAFAGDGEEGCPQPGAAATATPIRRVTALGADSRGNVYFFSQGCERIFRVDTEGAVGLAGVNTGDDEPAPELISGVAFPAGSLRLLSVSDLAIDGNGNVWVAQGSSASHSLLLIAPSGVAMHVGRGTRTEVREGPMEQIGFSLMESLAAIPGGGVAIAQNDTFMSTQVQPPNLSELGVIGADGNYSLLLARDGSGGAPSPQFQGIPLSPLRVRVSPTGDIYFQDSRSESVFHVAASGQLTHFFRAFRRAESVVPGAASPVFRILVSTSIVADAAGNLYIGDRTGHKIYRLGADGLLTHVAGNGTSTNSGDGGSPLDAGFTLGSQLGIDAEGRVYFTHIEGASVIRVRRFTVDGTVETILGGGSTFSAENVDGTAVQLSQVNLPWAVAPDGRLYYFEPNQQLPAASDFVWRLGLDGKLTRFLGSPSATPEDGLTDQPALDAYLKRPLRGLAVDAAGTLLIDLFPPNTAVHFVDEDGVVRALTETELGEGDLVDGGPTISAPQPAQLLGRSWTAGGVFVYAGGPSTLAEYQIGGNVRILRPGGAGLPRQDGALLSGDRLLFNRGIAAMPDGGLAWAEKANNYVTIRRGFPVPGGCTYTASADELSVGGGNNLTQFSLTTGADCPWTAGSSATWVEILSARIGKGGTTVQLRALANPSPAERRARVRIAGKEVIVIQAPTTREDIFYLSPSAAVLPPTGGAVELSIIASPQQSWQVSLPDGPITPQGPAAGTGPATLIFEVGSLPEGMGSRTLAVQINGVAFPISQAAPIAPVAVTVSSTLSGATAIVDLVERELPYETQWLPGSFHHLGAHPFALVSNETLRQFQGWSDGSAEPSRLVRTPTQALALSLSARNIHRLRVNALANANPAGVTPAVTHRGFALPNDAGVTIPDRNEGFWYEEGTSIGVLAPNTGNLRFVSFSGDLVSTANPATLQMDGPFSLTANYTPDAGLPGLFRLGGFARWSFFGESRGGNPAQITVVPGEGQEPETPQYFVSYNTGESAPPWLQVRQSGTASPLTMELAFGSEAASAVSAGTATVYLHVPNAATQSLQATFHASDPPVGTAPWIAAITDAGGFRQSLGDTQDFVVASPGMILSLFGGRLAVAAEAAEELPLPTNLAGTVVEYLLGSGSVWQPVPLFFVSSEQINFQVPPGLEEEVSQGGGAAVVFRVRREGSVSPTPFTVILRSRSASLFTADSFGFGAPAGHYVRVRASGIQERGPLYDCPVQGTGPCDPAPAPVGGEDEELYLELFGTGFSDSGEEGELAVFLDGKPVEVIYAGPQSQFAGLDQLNVKVPVDVRKGEPLDLYLWVRNGSQLWIASNRLTLLFE